MYARPVMRGARRVLLSRHGETEANRDHHVQGRNVNFGLTENGKEQNFRLARFLCSHDMRPDIILASPLVRAQESAHIIGTFLGVPTETHEDLSEIDFGDIQSFSLEDMKKTRVDAIDYYAGLDINIIYPGGEEVRNARARMVNSFFGILQQYPTENLLIVSHGGVLRLLMSWILYTDHIQPLYHANTGLTVLECLPDIERFLIRTLNSTIHLTDPCYA